jgi:crotonobetainyl-CoA:carnitine CoA-transferase CaiB-like acyl-CoA transferase
VGLLQTLVQPGVGNLPYAPLPGLAQRRPLAASPAIGEHSREVLGDWGWSPPEIQVLLAAGALVQGCAQKESR